MKCPECGKWADVLETRRVTRFKPNFTRRRYECGNQHRFTTREYLWDATSKDAILTPENPTETTLAE